MTSHWTWDGSKFTFDHGTMFSEVAKRAFVGLAGAVTVKDADLTEFLIHSECCATLQCSLLTTRRPTVRHGYYLTADTVRNVKLNTRYCADVK
jgi:hypothetical protein